MDQHVRIRLVLQFKNPIDFILVVFVDKNGRVSALKLE